MLEKALICDANILIDYCEVDKSVILKACELFEFYVPDIVLAEINRLDEKEARELGISIFETPLEVLGAAMEALPGCSEQDTVCFLMARENGWACATNDALTPSAR